MLPAQPEPRQTPGPVGWLLLERPDPDSAISSLCPAEKEGHFPHDMLYSQHREPWLDASDGREILLSYVFLSVRVWGDGAPAPGSETHCPSLPVSLSIPSHSPPVSPPDHLVHHEKGFAPGLQHCALTAGSLGPFLSHSLLFSLEAPIRPRLSPQSQLLPAPVTCTGSLDDTPSSAIVLSQGLSSFLCH